MNQGPNWNSGVNDVAGFLQQVLVFPLWTSTRVIGFNLPSWSLPVDALACMLFLVQARRRLLGVIGTSAMRLVAVAMNLYSRHIADGPTTFFMGGPC